MRESCTYGSVRGARGNSRPYRDPGVRGRAQGFMRVTPHSCPYRFRTWRQLFPTRPLLAAKVAPQRSRLLQVMPPERSQSRAAAGRQGAKSFMSMALAVVTENPRNKIPNSDLVMSLTPPPVVGEGVS